MFDGLVLGIETATTVGGVAIVAPDGPRVSLHGDLGMSHSRRISSLIAQALELADTEARDLAAVGVSLGPGSFTGVRIGMSVAKGLCLVNETPLIGVSTLEATAVRSVVDTAASTVISPILDARRGEVYAAAFRPSDNEMDRLCEDSRATLEEWLGNLEALAGGGGEILFCGQGAALFADEIEARFADRARFAHSLRAMPGADGVAWLAAQRLREDPGAGAQWDTLEPEYVRDHDARRPDDAR